MIALGIDPGTRRVGYGIVRCEGSKLSLVAAGILKVKGVDDTSALVEIKAGMEKLFAHHCPDVIGVEKLFFARNRTTAIPVAEARGVILLSAAERGIPIREYAPNEVKLGVAGYGLADKRAVLKMVRLTLGARDLRVIDDASDALALAIMAAGRPVD